MSIDSVTKGTMIYVFLPYNINILEQIFSLYEQRDCPVLSLSLKNHALITCATYSWNKKKELLKYKIKKKRLSWDYWNISRNTSYFDAVLFKKNFKKWKILEGHA